MISLVLPLMLPSPGLFFHLLLMITPLSVNLNVVMQTQYQVCTRYNRNRQTARRTGFVLVNLMPTVSTRMGLGEQLKQEKHCGVKTATTRPNPRERLFFLFALLLHLLV